MNYIFSKKARKISGFFRKSHGRQTHPAAKFGNLRIICGGQKIRICNNGKLSQPSDSQNYSTTKDIS